MFSTAVAYKYIISTRPMNMRRIHPLAMLGNYFPGIVFVRIGTVGVHVSVSFDKCFVQTFYELLWNFDRLSDHTT